MAVSGFYVPSGISGSYVASKKTNTGAYESDAAAGQVGVQHQAALQSLNKSYSQTVNDAYSSYLNAKRGIRGSQLGQGYKEAYLAEQESALNQGLTEVATSAASVRNELAADAGEAYAGIQSQMQLQADYLNKTAVSVGEYFDYVKSLDGVLSEEQQGKTIDEMYDTLLALQPRNTNAESDSLGLAYSEWIKSKYKDGDEWSTWLLEQGGLNEFKKMLNTLSKTKTKT